MDIGQRLRQVRKQLGLTLQKLSELTNLSVGYLSNVERGLTSPSVSNLQRICGALNINLVNLIQPAEENKIIVRVNERREMFYSQKSKIKYELITQGNKKINGICIVMEVGADYGKVSSSHASDELGIVVKGKMELKIGDDTYILSEGDTVYIKANEAHRYKNVGDTECVSYWVLIGSVETNF